MSHEMTATDTMYSGRGITPWHGLGNVVEGRLNAEQAIVAAGVDWEVVKRPVFVPVRFDEHGLPVEFVAVEGKTAIVREDTGEALHVANDSYQLIQNTALFEFGELLMDQGLEYETAGSLRGGRNVYALAAMPDNIKIGDDEYFSYVLCGSSHDGTLAMSVLPTNVRVVCANTFTAALFGANRVYRIRHSGDTTGKIDEARKALEMTFSINEGFVAEMEQLLDQAVTDAAFEAIVKGLLPTSDTEGWEANRQVERDKLRQLWHHAPTVANVRGTAYGVVQAVSEWELHGKAKPSTPEDQAFAFMQGRALKSTAKVVGVFEKATKTGAKLTDDSVLMGL